eukprot:TRINITY_DN2025_c0_g2_i2.p1 TRINITY_DN2025_c0_g2~~TRINITY_DN2025_c0_g2_i2.p1  ORF type:complete len:773 (-),score=107.90 TRINITY_DN2025_c0_g2_i2:19-2337(-)
MVSWHRQLRFCVKKTPDVWKEQCEYNLEIALALCGLFIVFLSLLSTVAGSGHNVNELEFHSSPAASQVGIACGVFGTVGVASMEFIAQRVKGRRSQKRAVFLALVVSLSLNSCIATFAEKQIRHIGLLGLSVMTKCSLPMLAWDIPASVGFLCTYCVILFTASWLSMPADGDLNRVGLILSEVFFTLVALVHWLAHNRAVQEVFEALRWLEVDNTSLKQVIRLSSDGEFCISVDDNGDAWIDSTNPQLVEVIGWEVEGECLRVIMGSDNEYQRALNGLKDTIAGPMLRSATLMTKKGTPLHVELFAVRLQGPTASWTSLGGQGPYLSSKAWNPDGIYLVGIRIAPSDGGGRSNPVTPVLRNSPAESVGSVLPHVIGRCEGQHRQDSMSDIFRDAPSPAASSSGLRSAVSHSSDLFHKGQLDYSKLEQVGASEHWLIDKNELEIQPYSILGKGGFGLVLEAGYFGIQLAAKITRKSQSGSLEDLQKAESFVTELRMLRHARHPNIVQFYGACIESQSREIVLVFEKINAPTLGQFLADLPQMVDTKPLRNHQFRVKIMLDLSRALDYLHARKPAMTHGDLKPANIFVHLKGPCAMLSDFGLARKMSDNAKAGGFTTRWAAPEIVKGTSVATTAADVFGFGRLMSFIITDKSPLHGYDETAIINLMSSRRPLPKIEWPQNHLSDICSGLVESCLSVRPEKRPQMPTIRQLLEKAPNLLASGRHMQGPALNLLALLPAVNTQQYTRSNAGDGREGFLRALELARECLENGPASLT